MDDPHDVIGQYFVAIHHEMFRPGEAARIEGITEVRGCQCFHIRYPDGVEDDSPIENEDFVGKGGRGVFYEIRPR
jgi:hypothetical protein